MRDGSRCWKYSLVCSQIVSSGARKIVFSMFARSAGGIWSSAVVCAVQLVKLGGPHREQRAAFEDLNLDAHLEHVGRGGHRDIGLLGLGEHASDGVGCRRLHA